MKKAIFGQFHKLDYSGNEALNTICSNLQFTGQNMRKIAFTSCNPDDGKSFVVMQIAHNLARRGKRVVVVDTDFRKSHIIRKLKMETDGEWIGLAHYLAGYSAIEDIVYETNLRNMYFVPIGRTVVNPVWMLDSLSLRQLLDALAQSFDFVLVDTPPIGAVVDAALAAQACDGVVFVVQYNVTRRAELRDAQKQILQSGCPILGAIINKVTLHSLSDKKYYKKAYYAHYSSGHDPSKRPAFQRGR